MSKSKSKTNYTELTHQVVRESPEPLPFVEIMGRVAEIAPTTTRNPKGTIRSAISQSRLIVATGDGRYGWLPRLITGSALRLTLSPRDIAGQGLEFGDEVRDALWPSFFETQKRNDRRPVQVRLLDGALTEWPLDFFGESRWGTTGSPEFWRWFKHLKAHAKDHLIVTALDGDARLYGVTFQRRAERDEAAITARNQAVVNAALEFVRRRPDMPPLWDITPHLLATGQYRHPVPPDPLDEIWTRDVWEPEARKKGAPAYVWVREDTKASDADELMQQLFGAGSRVYDVDNPPDLPIPYQPREHRQPMYQCLGRESAINVFCLRVRHRAWPEVWRDIDLLEDQTLEDLHLMIQRSFGWRDDHLYSFFMSGRVWDRYNEIGSPWSESARHTHQVKLRTLGLKAGQRFVYLFDYGDGHEFDVEVREIKPKAKRGYYPRIAAKHGRAPAQY
jgi:hypothetical protein